MRRRLGLAARETFRSFGLRNFRLFFIGQFISQVGNWLTMTAAILLVHKLADSALAIGLLTACQFGPLLLFGAWSGLLADRVDKRKLLLVVQFGAMAKSLAFAGLAFLDHPPLVGFYVIAVLGGIATTLDNPARRSFITELVPETHVQNAVSLNTAVMTSSRIFGAALAGLIITTAGYGWAFLLDALSYVAVLWSLWRLDTSQLRISPVVSKGKGQVVAGLRYIRSVPTLWVSLVMTALIGMLTFNFQVVFPDFVERSLGGDEQTFALLFSITSVGSLFGALSTARRTTAELRHVVVGACMFGLAMFALSAAPTLTTTYGFGVLVGFASMAFFTVASAIVQLRSDPMMRGRVLAIQSMVFLGSTPIGGPILGAICDTFGPRVGLAVGGVAALTAAGFGALMLRRGAGTDRIGGDLSLDAGLIPVA